MKAVNWPSRFAANSPNREVRPVRDVLADRLVRGVWHEQCEPVWHALAPKVGDAVMAANVPDRFHAKQGRSIARWTLGADHSRLAVFIKRHYQSSLAAGVLAALFPEYKVSAARREAANLRWANTHGFRVPRTIAVGERIGPWGQLQSYLALEELAGMAPLHEAIPAAARFLSPAAFCRWKRELAGALARVVSRLHGRKRFHKDLYLCHFYIPERLTRTIPKSFDDELVMIDLHRLGHHPLTAIWWRLKDLAQLLYSSDVHGITVRDRLRFARLYAGGQHRTLGWRIMRWAVGVRWRNYHRHNESRRTKQAA